MAPMRQPGLLIGPERAINVAVLPKERNMARISFLSTVADVFGGLEDGRRAAVRYRELSRLSDEQLKSRGLSRSNLARRVMQDIA